MIVDNFDIKGAPVFPAEADPPSLVDSDSVLTCPISLQSFEAVTGWSCQVVENTRTMKVEQLPARRPLQGLISCDRQIIEQVLGLLVFEGLDHGTSILRETSYLKCNVRDLQEKNEKGRREARKPDCQDSNNDLLFQAPRPDVNLSCELTLLESPRQLCARRSGNSPENRRVG